ncbi:MAG: nucleoside-diphosphate kinase [Candidatus Omnitrophica bacterium]|nr:nucleoside-diphosphate kinase [Candidatus Omnitrophota bacterium]MBU1869347.1 nucleoside-diphosphate kinase [Candidatus Omnitrophota bacterium]
MNQAALILIKPDGLKKSLTGNILTRLSETKLEIVAAKMVRVSKPLAEEHYRHLKDKPFFPEIIKYLQGELHDRKKVMALVYWGKDAIKKCRELAGATNPEEADPTSIRGSYGRITTGGIYENVIHVSSDEKDAEREIKLWFSPDEIIVDLYPAREVIEKEHKASAWAQ